MRIKSVARVPKAVDIVFNLVMETPAMTPLPGSIGHSLYIGNMKRGGVLQQHLLISHKTNLCPGVDTLVSPHLHYKLK